MCGFQTVDPIPRIITKDKISEDEVLQCKQVIYNLISQETKHEPLNLVNLGQRMKGQKREEQYKVMWNELETLLKNNLHSENHRSIYNALLECHKFNLDEEKMETDPHSKEIDHIEQDVQRASVIRATTDSPMSPPPLTSISVPLSRQTVSRNGGGIYSAPRSLLDIFQAQDKGKLRPDFVGRSPDVKVAKLYPNLKVENDRPPRGEGMEVE